MWRQRTIILFSLLSVVVFPFPFKDYGYDELTKKSLDLHGQYAISKTANELLNIKNAELGNAKCSPVIIRVTHVASYESDNQRPQLIISGEIHGDERVVSWN